MLEPKIESRNWEITKDDIGNLEKLVLEGNTDKIRKTLFKKKYPRCVRDKLTSLTANKLIHSVLLNNNY